MAKSEPKKMGRPVVNATPITVRVPPALLARIDAYRATLPDEPSRPETIRSMIEALLHIVEKDLGYVAKD